MCRKKTIDVPQPAFITKTLNPHIFKLSTNNIQRVLNICIPTINIRITEFFEYFIVRSLS